MSSFYDAIQAPSLESQPIVFANSNNLSNVETSFSAINELRLLVRNLNRQTFKDAFISFLYNYANVSKVYLDNRETESLYFKYFSKENYAYIAIPENVETILNIANSVPNRLINIVQENKNYSSFSETTSKGDDYSTTNNKGYIYLILIKKLLEMEPIHNMPVQIKDILDTPKLISSNLCVKNFIL